MRTYLLHLVFVFIIVGCNKNESYEYYYQKADEKRNEIEKLVKTFPCGDLSSWRVDTLPGQGINFIYFPIHKTANSEYIRLKNEYETLLEKAKKLDDRTIYYDFLPNPPITLECVDGHPKVMTAYDYNLEKAISVLNAKVMELESMISSNTCNATDQWHLIQLIKDCKTNYAVVNKNDATLLKKVRIIQEIIMILEMRITSLDQSKKDCFKYDYNIKSFEVSCENNKPVVKITR